MTFQTVVDLKKRVKAIFCVVISFVFMEET